MAIRVLRNMKHKTIFAEYFGDSPIARVIDFFIENDLYDYSKTDIYRNTGIARTTLQNVIKTLLKKKIIIKLRNVGRAEMYKLNRRYAVVEEIIKFAINMAVCVAKQEAHVKPIEA